MENTSLGFIGGGRVTRIFLQALKNKKKDFQSVVVCDTNADVLKKLKNDFPGIQTTAENGQAARQNMVFIALHPPVIMETLESIASEVSGETIIVSLAPKIRIENIEMKLNSVSKVVRLIPNATSVINEGYNPVCFSEAFDETGKIRVMEILKVLGDTFEVKESKLEAYAIISAMAPTYFWFQWMKLAEIGKEIGLDRQESKEAVYKTIAASLNTLYKSGLTDEQVLDLIPVKPIGEHEDEIKDIFNKKLMGLYEKIK